MPRPAELHKTGYFRKIKIRKRVYYIPVTKRLADILPKEEVFFGTFLQAMLSENLRLVESN